MSRKKRYIQKPSEKKIAELKAGKNSKKSRRFAQRCHAILLSIQGFDTNQIAEIFGVRKNTIYDWFNSYEEAGIKGLEDASGRGRKPVLRTDNKEHVKVVDKAVAKVNKKGGNLLSEIEAELDLERGLSRKMLRTFLKKLVMSGNEEEE